MNAPALGRAAIALGAVGASGAIGAGVADKHPAIGAAVGTGALMTVFTTLIAISNPIGPVDFKGAVKVTALPTIFAVSGAALGAASNGKHPSIGAFIGAVAASGLVVAANRIADSPSPPKQAESSIGTSGSPRVARSIGMHLDRRVDRAGAFL